MRRAILPILVITLAAAPLTAGAQQPVPDHGRMAMRGMRAAPLAHILARREALGLSEQQVNRIEEIRAGLEAKNRPLLEQLREAVPDSLHPRRERALQRSPEQRAEAQERMRALRERVAQLTPEERAALREEMRERRRERLQQITPEQRAEMRERATRMRERRAERPRLTEEQLTAVRPILEQLRANTEQALRDAHAVLTAEQLEQLRERRGAARFMGAERGPRRSPRAR